MSSSSTKFGRTAWTFTWESLGRSSAFTRSTAYRRPLNFKFAHQHRPISHNHARRNYSGGLLLLSLDTSGTSSQTIVASCNSAATATAESSIIGGTTARAGTVGRLARQAWFHSVHTTSGSSGRQQRRLKSTNAGEDGKTITASQKTSQVEAQKKSEAVDAAKNKVEQEHHDSLTDSVSKYLHLPHLPKMPHRPTKEELLAAATGFWQRMKVRFKWFSIRSTRPFNADEWGAFLSWIIFGHFVWILVGTTTFVSLLILMVNTVFAQGMCFAR